MGPAPPMRVETVVVVLPALGAAADPAAAADLAGDALVIAVDSGIDHALALGLPVHRAVGDFDSVTSAGLADVVGAGAVIDRHPAAKDHTDFELALSLAAATGAGRIVVLGGRGGRLDHSLANLLSLAAPALAPAQVVAHLDGSLVTVVRDVAELVGTPGSLVSLLPLGGPARAVTTDGLRYPLMAEDLEAGTSRGISNVLLETPARVSLTNGVLLAVQPATSDVDGVGHDPTGGAP